MDVDVIGDPDDFSAEVAIARARMKAVDWGYLVGGDGAAPEAMARGAIILAYAQFENMAEHFGPHSPAWRKFLREALNEVINRAEDRDNGRSA